MNQHATIDPKQFVELARQPLERRDTQALARLVHERWSHAQIVQLLGSDDPDARKLAALAIGFVGDRRCITALANCLRDPDPIVNQMAEHALWSVWFRAGTKQAQEYVQRGTELLTDKRLAEAIDAFTSASRLDPTYAEARNQRAITFYLMEDFHASIDDGQVVVQLMPAHFGAWAGLGHCWAHLGNTTRALSAYRRALSVYPRLGCVRQIVSEIQAGCCSVRLDPGAASLDWA